MRSLYGLGLLSLALVFSCSAIGEDDGDGNGNGNGNGSGNAGSGADGAGGDGFGIGGSGGEAETEVCQALAQEATPALQAADIIFAIDTSGSMGDESAFVNSNMNAFSQQIIDSGIDVHVVMLAENQLVFPAPIPLPITPPGICIAAPLGSGDCPDDTNLDQYFHSPNSEVSSTDGLNVILSTYGDWSFMMRQGATKTIVVITDDNHSQPPYSNANDIPGDADQFIADFTALDPVMFNSWKMSGIYSFTDCPDAAQPGALWKEIIEKTGGLKGDLCQQQFQPIFDDLAAEIIVGAAQIDCSWDIPAPPEGETLDPSLVNVVYTDGAGAEHPYGKVASEAECDPTLGGWYYDDNANPSRILLCQASCDQAQSDTSGKIDILFGCATEVLIAD